METLLAVVLATLAVVAMVVILLVVVMLLLTIAMVKVLMMLVVLHMMRVLASRRQRVSLALPWLHIQCGLRTETFLTVCIPLRTCIASLVATSPPHIHHVVPVFVRARLPGRFPRGGRIVWAQRRAWFCCQLCDCIGCAHTGHCFLKLPCPTVVHTVGPSMP